MEDQNRNVTATPAESNGHNVSEADESAGARLAPVSGHSNLQGSWRPGTEIWIEENDIEASPGTSELVEDSARVPSTSHADEGRLVFISETSTDSVEELAHPSRAREDSSGLVVTSPRVSLRRQPLRTFYNQLDKFSATAQHRLSVQYDSNSARTNTFLPRTMSSPAVLQPNSTEYDVSSRAINMRSRSESSCYIICRICHGSSLSEESLEAPCFCRGSIALVHLSCLETWLMESNTTFCEICGYPYTVKKVFKYSMLKGVWVWLTQQRRDYFVMRFYDDLLHILHLTPVLCLGCFLVNSAFSSDLEQNSSYARVMAGSNFILGAWIISFFFLAVSDLRHYFPVWKIWWKSKCYVKVVVDSEEEKERKRWLLLRNPARGLANRQLRDLFRDSF